MKLVYIGDNYVDSSKFLPMALLSGVSFLVLNLSTSCKNSIGVPANGGSAYNKPMRRIANIVRLYKILVHM